MNKTLLPKLRFPEFQDAGEWEMKMLGDICDVLNNRRRPISSDQREKGSYPYYGASGIVDYVNDFIFDERLLLVGEDGAKWGAFEKTAFLAEGKYWVNNHAHVLNATGINDVLLENYLTMIDVSPFVTGAAPPKLTLGKLKEIPVPVPSLIPEQQKIADCLTSLDDLIAAQSQKVAALQAYKKGLLQNLFPAEGESVPRLRFPEFEENWDETSLGSVSDDISSGKDKNDSNGEYDLYGSTSVIGKTSRDTYDGSFILVARVGANAGFLTKVNGKFGVTDNTLVLSLNQSTNIDFVFYYLENFGLNRLIFGSGQPLITGGQLKSLELFLPNVKEQQRIAELLSALDEQISAQGEALAALKVHKKGLLQGLFAGGGGAG